VSPFVGNGAYSNFLADRAAEPYLWFYFQVFTIFQQRGFLLMFTFWMFLLSAHFQWFPDKKSEKTQ
jgi:hypothetical protein